MQKRFSTEKLLTVICIAWGLFHLYTAFFGVLTAMWQRSIHLGFAMVVCFLMMFQKTDKKLLKALYIAMCLAAIGFVLYFLLDFKGIVSRYGRPNDIDLLFGGAIIILTLIFTAEKTGKILPGIAIVFILYAIFGQSLPGILGHRGYSVTRIINQMSLSTEGIFGTSLGVSATYIYIFMLFGALLTKTNIGQFYIDFALKALGKSPGGPAKAAIVSSCLFGSVSGSAVANVAGTGVVTIPLMKETGYKPEFAGAVEAVASTGGQIVPPMMGAAAFIMAEILGIPYYEIAIGAIIPALIYYASVFAMVHFRAKARDLSGMDTNGLPPIKQMLREKGIMVLPLLVLIVLLMVVQLTAMRASVYSVVVTVIIGFAFGGARLKEFIAAFVDAAKSALVVVASTACAGIIVSVINLTGLGLKFSSMMLGVANNSMFLVLVMLMLASMLLGMGLPTTPAYLILAVLGAPTLITLGVDPLAAHMFVFYFGAISMITPPVAMAVYAACSIAKSKFWPTAGFAVLLGLPAFIVPYMFVYEPAMLFHGSNLLSIIALVTGVLGAIFYSAGINGYFVKRTKLIPSIILVAAGIMMITPQIWLSVAGVVIAGIVFIIQKIETKKDTVRLS